MITDQSKELISRKVRIKFRYDFKVYVVTFESLPNGGLKSIVFGDDRTHSPNLA